MITLPVPLTEFLLVSCSTRITALRAETVFITFYLPYKDHRVLRREPFQKVLTYWCTQLYGNLISGPLQTSGMAKVGKDSSTRPGHQIQLSFLWHIHSLMACSGEMIGQETQPLCSFQEQSYGELRMLISGSLICHTTKVSLGGQILGMGQSHLSSKPLFPQAVKRWQ